MGVKHPFVSLVPNIGGPTYVQPTHWNAPLNTPPFPFIDLPAGLAVASFGIPSTAGATGMEYPANTPLLRTNVDFANVDYLYIAAGIASTLCVGSTTLRAQYAPSGFPASWYSFDSTAGSGPFVSVASGTNASLFILASGGMMFGPTVAVSAAAKALPQPLQVRFAAYGGNGSAIQVAQLNLWGF